MGDMLCEGGSRADNAVSKQSEPNSFTDTAYDGQTLRTGFYRLSTLITHSPYNPLSSTLYRILIREEMTSEC